MTYTTAAQDASAIRTELKKHYGITSRQVSVRASSYSMGSSIDVTINDPAVDIREVKNAADRHEKIDRCQVTGEILSGGNRYLSVSYGKKAAAALVQQQPELLARIIACAQRIDQDGTGYDTDGFLVMRTNAWECRLSLVDKPCGRGHHLRAADKITAEEVAEAILGLRA